MNSNCAFIPFFLFDREKWILNKDRMSVRKGKNTDQLPRNSKRGGICIKRAGEMHALWLDFGQRSVKHMLHQAKSFLYPKLGIV